MPTTEGDTAQRFPLHGTRKPVWQCSPHPPALLRERWKEEDAQTVARFPPARGWNSLEGGHGAGRAPRFAVQIMNAPPLTFSVSPVMNDAASEARKAMACAISRGVARRPIGMVATRRAWSSDGRSRIMPVSTGPGATAFTRTPRPADCAASDIVRPITPALEAT